MSTWQITAALEQIVGACEQNAAQKAKEAAERTLAELRADEEEHEAWARERELAALRAAIRSKYAWQPGLAHYTPIGIKH
jgi:uncharacterized membrane protein